MTGDIFFGHVLGRDVRPGRRCATGQTIQLLGMLTEAMHTPLLHDRYLALENATVLLGTARHLRTSCSSGPAAHRAAGPARCWRGPRPAGGDRRSGASSRRSPPASSRTRAAGRRRQGAGRRGGSGHAGYLNPFYDLCLKGAAGGEPRGPALRRHHGDGAVQLSFTLPVPVGSLARRPPRQLRLKMNLDIPRWSPCGIGRRLHLLRRLRQGDPRGRLGGDPASPRWPPRPGRCRRSTG